MVDQPDTRTFYRTRIILDLDAPIGDYAWQFSTHADEKGVAVSQVVLVEKKRPPSET